MVGALPCRVLMEKLPTLNLPAFPFRFSRKADKPLIFDEVRRKYLQLTPEEWVRQHFIQFLIGRGYPKGCISIERKIAQSRKLLRRTDIVIFDRQLQVFMLVECKAPSVKITNAVFEQASQYNVHLKASVVVVTNGLDHFVLQVDHRLRSYSFLPDLPPYPSA